MGVEEDGPTNDTGLHGYNHSLEQERRLFNPQLFNVTKSEFCIYGVALPVFSIVSIVSNAFVFLVLLHKNRTGGRTALSILLQCLAQYDVGVALLALLTYTIPTWCQHFQWQLGYLHDTHPLLLPYLVPILHMFITGSDYLNLAAAVERYLALDRYFAKTKSPHMGFSIWKTAIYIVGILAFTIAFNFPAMFERETVIVDEHLEVVPTALRFNEVYIRMYRLMAEFLIFKVTPWMAFLILFLSLRDRLAFYRKRGVRVTLSVKQYCEILDSRIILGINALFYVTNALALYVSFVHIILSEMSDDVMRVANVMLVVNSTFKLFVYLALSMDFRHSVKSLFFVERRRHWVEDQDKGLGFLSTVRVAAYAQAEPETWKPLKHYL
jgi:hypothetical protein